MDAGHSMVDIDEMDFLFYLDVILNKNKNIEQESIVNYDKLGI